MFLLFLPVPRWAAFLWYHLALLLNGLELRNVFFKKMHRNDEKGRKTMILFNFCTVSVVVQNQQAIFWIVFRITRLSLAVEQSRWCLHIHSLLHQCLYHSRPGQLYWILFNCIHVFIFVECHIVRDRSHLAFWWLYYFCIPMRTKWHFPLCYILVHVWWHHLSYSDKPASSLYLIALICSFLITCDIEYLFMCLFSLCVSIVIYCGISFCLCPNFGLFIFLLIFKISLYILDGLLTNFSFVNVL